MDFVGNEPLHEEVLAAKWVVASVKTKDNYPESEFTKFAFLWFALNHVYSNYLDKDYNEKEALKMAWEKHFSCREEIVKEVIGSFGFRYFVNSDPIIDLRRGTVVNGYDFKQDNIIKGSYKSRFNAFSGILYHVRCNLFHGGKYIESERDCEIVSAAVECLTIILTKYFELDLNKLMAH